MDDNSPLHDFSRLDDWLRARREAEAMKQRAVLNLARGEMARGFARPLLLGACGAAIVVLAAYVAVPTFRPKLVEIPVLDVTHTPVTVPDITMKPVEIPVPRTASVPETSAVTPRTPVERRFEDGKDWRDPSVVVRGRIVRQDGRGFVLATDEGETSFFPAKIGPDGRPVANLAVKSVVAPYLGDLCFCSRLPIGTFHCVALHNGVETAIAQVPIGGTAARPLTGASAPGMILVRLEVHR
jgi:hypothetical protein